MTEWTDRIEGLVVWALNTEGITDLTGVRIFGGELDENLTQLFEAEQRALKTVLFREAGGFGTVGGGGYQQYGERRVDVFCYGETPYDASKLHNVVHAELKQLRRIVPPDTNILIHRATQETGPNNLRDPDTDWPFTQSAWNVLTAEVPITA